MPFFIELRCTLWSSSFVYAHLKEKLQLVHPASKLFFMKSGATPICWQSPYLSPDIKNNAIFSSEWKKQTKPKQQEQNP